MPSPSVCFMNSNSFMFSRLVATSLCMNTKELVTDVGSVLDGEKAVAEGLIDQLGSLADALGALYGMIEG